LAVLAVDDEQPALDELVHLLQSDGRVTRVVPTLGAAGAVQALMTAPAQESALHGHGVDAVFLDIRMPGHSGIEIARALGRMSRPPVVVFITADDSHAVTAFDIGAVDYLLKPLRADRLAASVDRVLAALAAGDGHADGGGEVIPAELGGVTTLVRQSSVLWVQANGDYVRLHTADGSHLVRLPLKVLAQRWERAGFALIHRSYLVSLAAVEEVIRTGPDRKVRIRTGDSSLLLPVSRRAYRDLKARLHGR
jgi:DNA-binding LytR/AlgR family response regulator